MPLEHGETNENNLFYITNRSNSSGHLTPNQPHTQARTTRGPAASLYSGTHSYCRVAQQYTYNRGMHTHLTRACMPLQPFLNAVMKYLAFVIHRNEVRCSALHSTLVCYTSYFSTNMQHSSCNYWEQATRAPLNTINNTIDTAAVHGTAVPSITAVPLMMRI